MVGDAEPNAPDADDPGALLVSPGTTLLCDGNALSAPIENDGVVELRSGLVTSIIGGTGAVQIDPGYGDGGSGFDGLPVGPTLLPGQLLRFDGPNAALLVSGDASDPDQPLAVSGFATTDALAFDGLLLDLSTTDTSDGLLVSLSGSLGIHGAAFTDTVLLTDLHQSDLDAAELFLAIDPTQTGPYGEGYTTLSLCETVSCFCVGTLLSTPSGERTVESLQIGDPVSTAAGTAAPVLWIGRRTYPTHVAAHRPDLHPVLILAGALGHGLPRRDLLLSPEHAVLANGHLVPASLLVNHVSILREPPAGELTYLHVELERHDLLLAEGAPAESFVDDGGRVLFDNAAEYERLYPGRASTPPAWCLPRIEHGPELVAARQHIDRLAGLSDRTPPAPLLG